MTRFLTTIKTIIIEKQAPVEKDIRISGKQVESVRPFLRQSTILNILD